MPLELQHLKNNKLYTTPAENQRFSVQPTENRILRATPQSTYTQGDQPDKTKPYDAAFWAS